MKNTLYFLATIFIFISCKSKTEQKSNTDKLAVSIDQQSIKKIDVHTHYRYERNYLPEFFKKWNMQGVLVDVSKVDSVYVNRSWNEYVTHANANSDLFSLGSSLIGVGIDESDFADKQIARLEKEIEQGAKLVKVWKNFGMVTKDDKGKFIQIDDTRLQPIWDFLKERNIPVMAHIGEPVQAWRPLNDQNNPHYGYYKNNPQYHAYHHPEVPSYETIITARDNWIANNPDLKILCAHFGSMSHDVDMIAERLDKYPNMNVESAARFGDLIGQDSDKVRRFFEKYQDRILFGTDYGNSSSQDGKTVEYLKQEQQNLDEDYDRLWRYVTTTDSIAERGQKNIGLGLSNEVLNKFYYQNAIDFLKLK